MNDFFPELPLLLRCTQGSLSRALELVLSHQQWAMFTHKEPRSLTRSLLEIDPLHNVVTVVQVLQV